MITPEKIDEWIKEVEERPGSAVIILQYISNRLRDLTQRNQELRADNLALRTEKKVEEYERRIANLEYQLDLLKRQFGGDPAVLEALASAAIPVGITPDVLSVLVYDAHGHILRLETDPAGLTEGALLGTLPETPGPGEEPLRLLVSSAAEEMLFVFSSGRVSTRAVASIPAVLPDHKLDWEQASQPDEPRGGETLGCLTPVSRMALSDYFVQTSLRGWVKKVGTTLASSILEKHYIGTGVTQPGDRTFNVVLAKREERLVLVSRDGYGLCLEVQALPFAVESAFKLGNLDFIAAAFITSPGRPVLVMTQLGKVVHLGADYLDPAGSLRSRGQALYSQQRREKGVKVVGAAALQANDWTLALHKDGRLTVHSAHSLIDSGAMSEQDELVGFTGFGLPVKKSK